MAKKRKVDKFKSGLDKDDFILPSWSSAFPAGDIAGMSFRQDSVKTY